MTGDLLMASEIALSLIDLFYGVNKDVNAIVWRDDFQSRFACSLNEKTLLGAKCIHRIVSRNSSGNLDTLWRRRSTTRTIRCDGDRLRAAFAASYRRRKQADRDAAARGRLVRKNKVLNAPIGLSKF